MTAEGYRNRIYAVEWHAELWRRNGAPIEQCEAMMQHCSSCVEADFYGEPRYLPLDYWSEVMEAYFDRLFASAGNVVSYD